MQGKDIQQVFFIIIDKELRKLAIFEILILKSRWDAKGEFSKPKK